mgnify:CR=1 FL=1
MDAVGEAYPSPSKQCCVFAVGMFLQGFNGVQLLYIGHEGGGQAPTGYSITNRWYFPDCDAAQNLSVRRRRSGYLPVAQNCEA